MNEFNSDQVNVNVKIHAYTKVIPVSAGGASKMAPSALF